MPRRRPFLLLCCLAALTALAAGCRDAAAPDPGEPAPLRLLALGDSYTAGEGVAERLSWPRQLADSLAAAGDTLGALRVVATTGWTAADLRAALPSIPRDEPYHAVTLMIGANDAFEGRPPGAYAADLAALLDAAADLAGGDRGAVIAVTIPDFLVTPVGAMLAAHDPPDLAAYDAALRSLADERGAAVVDVTPLSRLVVSEPELLARDGLHYSAEMYRRWVGLLRPAVTASAQPRGR